MIIRSRQIIIQTETNNFAQAIYNNHHSMTVLNLAPFLSVTKADFRIFFRTNLKLKKFIRYSLDYKLDFGLKLEIYHLTYVTKRPHTHTKTRKREELTVVKLILM